MFEDMLKRHPCPVCGGEMVWREHAPGWKPKKRQQYYFERWLWCGECRVTRMVEEFKVHVGLSGRNEKPKGKRRGLSKRVQAEYGERTAALRELGFESYADYLASSLWARIRESVLARPGVVCYGCGDDASQVHHGSYRAAVLSGEELGDLFPVCRGCHVACETNRNGYKHGPKMATAKLRRRHKRWAREGLPEEER